MNNDDINKFINNIKANIIFFEELINKLQNEKTNDEEEKIINDMEIKQYKSMVKDYYESINILNNFKNST